MIALIDSGVGGLNVLYTIKELQPDIRTIYIADNRHFPYGTKSTIEVVEAIGQCLDGIRTFEVDSIYIACHTASIALEGGPLCVQTITGTTKELIYQHATKGTVAILGSLATIDSGYYQTHFQLAGAKIVEGFAEQNLIALIEEQCEDFELLKEELKPLIQFEPETILLGSTHFSTILPILKDLFPHATILDPAPAFAEKIVRENTPFKPTDLSEDLFITTKHNPKFLQLLQKNPINNLLKKGVGRV
ncbi:MAG: glutamate racemase [Chlamydiia bacterium]